MASSAISSRPQAMSPTDSDRSANWASTSTRQPWNNATVAPPSTLPSRMVARGSGDTSTSRRKPNWRSQITDTADCTEVYMMFSAITAGKMNCR